MASGQPWPRQRASNGEGSHGRAGEKARRSVGVDAQESARKQGVESKEGLPDFAVGNYVPVARDRQPGITPKLVNTWTRP